MSLGRSNGRVEITLPKTNAGKHWSSLGVAAKHDDTWVQTATEGETEYTVCLVLYVMLRYVIVSYCPPTLTAINSHECANGLILCSLQ